MRTYSFIAGVFLTLTTLLFLASISYAERHSENVATPESLVRLEEAIEPVREDADVATSESRRSGSKKVNVTGNESSGHIDLEAHVSPEAFMANENAWLLAKVTTNSTSISELRIVSSLGTCSFSPDGTVLSEKCMFEFGSIEPSISEPSTDAYFFIIHTTTMNSSFGNQTVRVEADSGSETFSSDETSFIVYNPEQEGDVNGDGKVNEIDIEIILYLWDRAEEGRADQDHDGIVTFKDLNIVLANYNEPFA